MTETTSPPLVPGAGLWQALTPYLGQALILLVTALIGAGGTLFTQWVTKKPEAAGPIPAMDRPLPTPIASLESVDEIVKTHCAAVLEKLTQMQGRRAAPGKLSPSGSAGSAPR